VPPVPNQPAQPKPPTSRNNVRLKPSFSPKCSGYDPSLPALPSTDFANIKQFSPGDFTKAEAAKNSYEDFNQNNPRIEPEMMRIYLDAINARLGYQPATLFSAGKWYLVSEPKDTISSKIQETVFDLLAEKLSEEGANLIKEGGGEIVGPISDISKLYDDAKAQKLLFDPSPAANQERQKIALSLILEKFANELVDKARKDGVYVPINPNAIKVDLWVKYQAWQQVYNDYSRYLFKDQELSPGFNFSPSLRPGAEPCK
jgi:hypothetical protein